MLPHYSPLKVAETFTILAALYPDRIDLGLGRAPGTDQLTTVALQRDRRQIAPDDFPQQLAELLAYFDDSLPADHPFHRLAATLPGRPALPEPWLLGSSEQSAIWAAQLALPYAFADFINPSGAELAALYRRRLAAERPELSPRTAVAAWVLCADTDEEARYLASSSRMAFLLLRQNRLIAVPPPDRATEFMRTEGRALDGTLGRRRAITGSPARVRDELHALAAEYGVDEVIVVTITYDHAVRLRSYELLAGAMEIEPRVGVAPDLTQAPAGSL